MNFIQLSIDLEHDLNRQRKGSSTYLKTSEEVAMKDHERMKKATKLNFDS